MYLRLQLGKVLAHGYIGSLGTGEVLLINWKVERYTRNLTLLQDYQSHLLVKASTSMGTTSQAGYTSNGLSPNCLDGEARMLAYHCPSSVSYPPYLACLGCRHWTLQVCHPCYADL